MSKHVGKFIQFGVIVVLLVVAIVANYYINFYKGIIDQYLGDNTMPSKVLNPEEGDSVVQSVAEEGFVLLKNENDTLPLKDVTKLNLFGWGSTDEGMLMCGGGSGDFTMVGQNGIKKEIVGLQKALEELEGLHPEDYECNGECSFEVNHDLVDFYESYCVVNRNGGTDSRPGWFNYNGDPKYFNLVEPDISEYPSEVLSSAKAFSDTAVVVITRTGGESLDLPKYQRRYVPREGQPASATSGRVTTDNDKTYLQLSDQEEGMIDYVKNNFENVIIVLNTSATVECGFIEDDAIDAAIYIATPGQSGTVALANILRGNVTPSGKLVDTYAYDLKTASTYANSPNANVIDGSTGEKSYNGGGTNGNYIDYAEGIYVGYRWYETADKMGYWDGVSNKYGSGYDGVVQYPFGFGLSYTDFTWTVKSVTPANNAYIEADTDIEIKIDVRNVGEVKGQDVVELYYEPPYTNGGIEKSSSNLVAFAKTEVLAPQQVQTLTLTFKGEDMKSYDYSDANNNGFKGYELESGDYFVKLSTDSHRVANVNGSGFSNGIITFKVENTVKIEKDSVTGYTVENRFTGDTADGGVSIDGTNSGANITYLTRGNFKGTFPRESTARRAASADFNPNGWKSAGRDTDVKPTQGSSGNLKLTENGVYNWELIEKLGAEENFDDPVWDQLLDQITETELQNVVLKGGYRTWDIPSIGKPRMTDLDGPTGFNRHPNAAPAFTGFPSAITVAGTWSTNIARYYGKVIGTEGRSPAGLDLGLGGWYAPGMNTHRSPFDGRNYEYFSEDPYISGMIGAYIVNGALQTGIYSYIKHFAINETEMNRNGLYTWLTEQSLREIYLKPFEISVKVGKANAIMTSYNRIGDTWTGGSYALMTEILRNEWGFKGTAISDYLDGSDNYKVVDQGIRAGSDIWLENGNDAAPGSIGYNDRSSATAVACAREATKHVVYTYCNTLAIARAAGNSTNEVIQAVDGFSTWKYFWIFGDILIFGALAAWAVIVSVRLIRALKKSKEAGPSATDQ